MELKTTSLGQFLECQVFPDFQVWAGSLCGQAPVSYHLYFSVQYWSSASQRLV